MGKSEPEENFAGLMRMLHFDGGMQREYRFTPDRRWRFDFAWPDLKVALEVEGGAFINGRHNRGAAFEADCEKYNVATALGWRVLRVTPRMVDDGRALNWIQLFVGG